MVGGLFHPNAPIRAPLQTLFKLLPQATYTRDFLKARQRPIILKTSFKIVVDVARVFNERDELYLMSSLQSSIVLSPFSWLLSAVTI